MHVGLQEPSMIRRPFWLSRGSKPPRMPQQLHGPSKYVSQRLGFGEKVDEIFRRRALQRWM